ncbi:hypothetical protein AGOR_G00009970 [Albula goreensis]|uniref:Secreted protein n=1 Tax=Albula goreensis TaxID=1534307 RepID=A0A8T3EB76_9TELE|nr:hypothetical protein AGOR_G00009970 [Albula goreensis]
MMSSAPAGLCFVVLSLVMAIALTLDSTGENGEKDHLLTENSRETGTLSGCVLSCTAQTYRQLLYRRDTRTVRFHQATTGDLGEHCWSTQIKSGVGERLQNTYIVVPVDKVTVSEAQHGLQPTFLHQQGELKLHTGPTAISEECGLRFDVTEAFASSMNRLKFCAKIIPQLNNLWRNIKCEPFLVTVWLRQHHSPT